MKGNYEGNFSFRQLVGQHQHCGPCSAVCCPVVDDLRLTTSLCRQLQRPLDAGSFQQLHPLVHAREPLLDGGQDQLQLRGDFLQFPQPRVQAVETPVIAGLAFFEGGKLLFLTFFELGYFLFVFLSSLGGFLSLNVVGLFLAKRGEFALLRCVFLQQGGEFALKRRILLLYCLQQLFEGMELRFKRQHFLAGGVVPLTGAGRQSSGQREAGRYKDKVLKH